MVTITTELATIERWDDIQRTLTGGGDGRSCQCTWFTLTGAQFDRASADERRDTFHAEVTTGPPPGLVAYVDGDAAGWVRVGPRTAQQRIARTRNIITSTPEPLGDEDVWAITCFSVRKEHRGIGVTSALLTAAIDHARAHGARVIEAYPIDTAVTKTTSSDLFHGALSTFVAAGFTATDSAKPGRPLASLAMTAAAD